MSAHSYTMQVSNGEEIELLLDPSWSNCLYLIKIIQVEADDRTRTDDIQLGKLTFYH